MKYEWIISLPSRCGQLMVSLPKESDSRDYAATLKYLDLIRQIIDEFGQQAQRDREAELLCAVPSTF